MKRYFVDIVNRHGKITRKFFATLQGRNFFITEFVSRNNVNIVDFGTL